MDDISCQVLVIGAGPGGYVAAIRAAQLGLDTVIVEGDKAGGTCLIRGCIPSKALIHASERMHNLAQHVDGHMGMKIDGSVSLNMKELVSWKDDIVTKLNKGVEHLLKYAGAKLISGGARFSDAKHCTVETKDGTVSIEAENVILATGSTPIELPFMKFDEEHICSSTGALDLDSLPERVAVIGGGYIGIEFAYFYSSFGIEVSIVESEKSILLVC